MTEKLHKGGPKRVKASSDMSLRERVANAPAWWKQRRAAKKRRLAKMTRKRRVWRRIGIGSTWLLGMIALLMVLIVVAFYTLTNVPRPEDLALPQVASILYSDGSLMAQIGDPNVSDQNRTIVRLDQVPEAVRYDVLAAEDRGFYSEPGVSIRGTLRAALTDLTGGTSQGGSGITQQYVKNAYLSDSHSLSRKFKELLIAVKLSRQYSKDQILEYYLNTVYFGRGAYGIAAAAQTFFATDISKLTLAQGAVLAAQLRDPGYYDPANNLDAAKARWTYVLDGMVSTGHLTKAQEATTKYPVAKKVSGNLLGASGPNALIVTRVLAELNADGIPESEVYARGLHIRTTIDKTAQSAAQSAIIQTFATLTPKQRNMKNALVAINPSTGGVLAYYGGANAKNYAGQDDEYDWAGLGAASPGSSFKPYTLATALTATLKNTPGVPHLTIGSYVDGSYCVKITGVQICNDPGDQGVSSSSVTVRNAMKYSLNTTFDQMAESVDPTTVAATAHAAGISKTINGKPTLVDKNGQTGFGIGIGDYPVHPLDQAAGFATFANKGVQNPAYMVDKVTDSNGATVFEHKGTPQQVLDPKVANDVTLTLEPIAAYSNDPLANGRISAAKTGTEGILNSAQGNNSDAWMVGYTPQVSAAVWVGSGNATTPIYNASGQPEYGSDLPGQTWALFMNTYLANKPNMAMATTQMVTGGQNIAAPPPSPTPTPTKTSSSAPPPPPPSVSLSPTAPTSVAPSTTAPSSPSPSNTPTCGGLLNPCPTTSGAAAPGPGG
ncbi:MAG: penicillin-binding protein [Actinomycetota bacterium]|nr:penicillin-binding protein [Actinomycetota bacterium]